MIRGRGQDDAGSTHGVPNYDGLCASASTSCPRPNGTVKLMILNKNQIGCKNVLVLRQVNLKQSFSVWPRACTSFILIHQSEASRP